MKLLSKLAIVGAAVATLGLSSTAAFAQTAGNQPPSYSKCSPGNQQPNSTPTFTANTKGSNGQPGGDNKNCPPNQPPKGDPCKTDSWSWGQPQGYTLFSDTKSDCKPVTPKPQPCDTRHGYDTSYIWQDGRYVQCCKPVRPVPVRCQCKVQNITFQLPTYGTWLLDVGGPALHNGESIKYDGQTWTVEDWTTGANGSQGHGTYFVLKDGTSAVKGLGTPKDHGPMLYEHATTICPSLHVSGFPSL